MPRLRGVQAVSVGEFIAFALEAPARIHRFREAEVEHLHRAVGAHLDVRGLEIAMDDALLVRRFERFGDLPRDRQRLVERDRPRARSAATSPRPRPAPSRARVTPPASSRPWMAAMFGWFSAASTSRFALEARQPIGIAGETSGRTLIATWRLSFVSLARYTSPMPPAPIAVTIRRGRGGCRE